MRRFLFWGGMMMAVQWLCAQDDVLRGEVQIDTEPVYALSLGQSSPLSEMDVEMWALEETALFYAARIYGWSFDYEPGDRARGIAENITLTPLGLIPFGDTRLRVDSAVAKGGWYSLWSEYRPSATQQQRLQTWKAAGSAEAQATGYGDLAGKAGETERARIKYAALEDAARRAIRARARAATTNRPLHVRGKLALSEFPIFGIQNSQWVANARFRLTVDELEHYALY